MSAAQPAWRSSGSTDKPIILTPRLSNSDLILAMEPSSVVQTGVKSFGWENSTAQELPIQSWKRILPSVVCASKSGATSLIARVITHLPRKLATRALTLCPTLLLSIVVGRRRRLFDSDQKASGCARYRISTSRHPNSCRPSDVRFTPKSGHQQSALGCACEA